MDKQYKVTIDIVGDVIDFLVDVEKDLPDGEEWNDESIKAYIVDQVLSNLNIVVEAL